MLRVLLKYLWALPATALGLLFWPLAAVSGGRWQVVEGVLELYGGWVTAFLRRAPPFFGPAAAMTLGHVILGADARCLARCRAHEHVHVRQYERWGPLLVPAYLLASLWLYWKGLDPYFDNPFEREAYERTDSAS